MDGLQATRAIKEERPTTSVLVVTSHENPEYLLDAIRAGAAGYVLKEATRHELLSAVRGTLQGESPLNQELAMRLLRRLAGEAGRRTEPVPEATGEKKRQEGPPPGSSPESLTARELEILRSLTVGKTNRQIAQSLTISRATVKTHVQRIIGKLGASDRTQAAVRAVKLGLLPERGGEW